MGSPSPNGSLAAGFDNSTRWLGFEEVGDARWHHRPLLPSLYGGTLGVALFFACVARARTGPGAATDAETRVHRILAPLARLDGTAPLRRWWRDQPLGLSGVGGTLLALLALDDLGFAPPGFTPPRQLALQLVEGADPSRFESALPLGIVAGLAGLVGPLLRLGSGAATKLAAQVGERLLRDAPGWAATAGRGFDGVDGMLAALAALRRDGRIGARDLGLADALRHCNAAATASGIGEVAGWRGGLGGIVLARLCLASADGEDAAAELHSARLAARLAAADFPDGSLAYGAAGAAAVLRIAAGNGAAEVGLPPGDCWQFARARQRRDDPGLMTGASGAGLVALDDAGSRLALATILSAGLLRRPLPQVTKLSNSGRTHLTT